MSDETPAIAQKGPYAYAVEGGKSYWWCACGKSKLQPFCDGSHNGTSFTPVEYRPKENGTVMFCGCKRSAGKPLCDGSHSKL